MDEDVYYASAITAHPLVNTATLVLEQAALQKFLGIIAHPVRVVTL